MGDRDWSPYVADMAAPMVPIPVRPPAALSRPNAGQEGGALLVDVLREEADRAKEALTPERRARVELALRALGVAAVREAGGKDATIIRDCALAILADHRAIAALVLARGSLRVADAVGRVLWTVARGALAAAV